MSYRLDPGQYAVSDLADQYRIDERDDLTEADLADLLAVALVETSTLMGDDSAKWAAMQHLIAALAHVDEQEDAETTITLDDLQITIEREKPA